MALALSGFKVDVVTLQTYTVFVPLVMPDVGQEIGGAPAVAATFTNDSPAVGSVMFNGMASSTPYGLGLSSFNCAVPLPPIATPLALQLTDTSTSVHAAFTVELMIAASWLKLEAVTT